MSSVSQFFPSDVASGRIAEMHRRMPKVFLNWEPGKRYVIDIIKLQRNDMIFDV